MIKQNYAIIAATFLLAGCQSQDVSVETKPTVEVESEAETSETAAEIETEEASALVEVNETELPAHNSIHVALTHNYKSEWSDEHQMFILKAESDNLHILNEDYDALNAALKQYNQENYQEVLGIYEEYLDLAKERAEEGVPGEWSILRNVDVVRSDDAILSFWNTQTDYLGGAHGGYYSSGASFDPKTGAKLELRDVVTDYGAFYQMVVDGLKENYEEESFFEGWQEVLDNMFLSEKEDETDAVEWTMDDKGITICLNPYVISSWAAGVIEVKIPFKGNEEMFCPEYLSENRGNIQKLLPGERYALSMDTNGNGEEDLISFSFTEDEDTFQNQFQIMKEDGDLYSSSNVELYGLFSDAYVVETEDGRPYLYVELSRENNCRLLEVFDLGEKFCHAGTCEASFYGNPIINTDKFLLYQKVYVLGTYMTYQEYHVGEDGMPVTDDSIFYVPDLGEDYGFELTSTRELPVKMHQDKEGAVKTDEILPAGTVFVLRKTDAETFAEMELSDGRRCDIILEKDMENYGYLIDGINEFECFEVLPYAG